MIVTDNSLALANALKRIDELEAENASLREQVSNATRFEREACIDLIDAIKIELWGCAPSEVHVYENGFTSALNRVRRCLIQRNETN